MSRARDDLLRRVAEHVGQHGLSDQSLRDLADAAGTSHRMLHYHFGGRAGVVRALVELNEADQQALLSSLAIDSDDPAAIVRAQWTALTDTELRPHLRLFFELVALAVRERPGTEGLLDELVGPWLDQADRAAADLGTGTDRTDHRLGLAVMRGLLLDLVITGDLEGTTAALERHLTRWH